MELDARELDATELNATELEAFTLEILLTLAITEELRDEDGLELIAGITIEELESAWDVLSLEVLLATLIIELFPTELFVRELVAIELFPSELLKAFDEAAPLLSPGDPPPQATRPNKLKLKTILRAPDCRHIVKVVNKGNSIF